MDAARGGWELRVPTTFFSPPFCGGAEQSLTMINYTPFVVRFTLDLNDVWVSFDLLLSMNRIA